MMIFVKSITLLNDDSNLFICMKDETERLAQVAGITTDQKTTKKLRQRSVQFLSLFGIDAQPQGTEVNKLIQFVTNMPEFKGEYHTEQYQEDWKQSPGIVQNQNNAALSRQGIDSVW